MKRYPSRMRRKKTRKRVKLLRRTPKVVKQKLPPIKKRLSKKCKSRVWVNHPEFSEPCEFKANQCKCISDGGSEWDAHEFYKSLKKEFGPKAYNDKTGKINYEHINSLL